MCRGGVKPPRPTGGARKGSPTFDNRRTVESLYGHRKIYNGYLYYCNTTIIMNVISPFDHNWSKYWKVALYTIRLFRSDETVVALLYKARTLRGTKRWGVYLYTFAVE